MPPSLKKVKFRSDHSLGYIVLNWEIKTVQNCYGLWLLMWNRRLPLDLNVLQQIEHSICIFSRWCASTWSLMLVENFDVFPHCTHCQIEELSTSKAFIMNDWTRASMSAQKIGYGLTYLWAVILVLVCRSNVKRQSSTGFKILKAEVTF